MKTRVFVRLFAFLLAINFFAEVVHSMHHKEMVQIEIDFDSDSEKEESKKEKETDKLNHKGILSKFLTQRENNLLALHFDNWWISPTIEMSSPPPELG